MYVYKITNKINNKLYIGITNNYKKRWANHKCCNSPNMIIAKAIKKYGVENFNFEILFQGLSIEEAEEKEIELIASLNTLTPNGYNIKKGGFYSEGEQRFGYENYNAHLTKEEAQYIKSHRNIPMYVLYENFSEKISYESFKKVYNNLTYTNITPTVDCYPKNLEFSCQFTSSKLDYGDIVELRQQYQNGVYWKEVYENYKHIYSDPWTFWNIYYGNKFKLVMPEVFTEENRKKHSSLGRKGSKNGRSKLKEDDVLKIRSLHKDGIKNTEIYKLYPQVSQTTIRDIINNKTWTHLL